MAAQEKQYRPFLFVKEGVKPDAETVNIRLEPDRNKGGNTKGTALKFDEEFYKVDCSEVPEQLVVWWKNYLFVLEKNEGLSWTDKKNILLHIVEGQAKKIVHEALSETGPKVNKHNWLWPIAQAKFKQLMEEGLDAQEIADEKGEARVTAYMSGYDVTKNKDTTKHFWSQPAKNDKNLEQYHDYVLKEIYFRLAQQVFGIADEPKNAFKFAKRMMRGMKIQPKLGVKKYGIRFNELNDMLEHCPWMDGALEGNEPFRYDEINCRDILEEVMPESYRKKLVSQKWSIGGHTFQETIDQLIVLEPQIKQDIENQQNIRSLLKAAKLQPADLTANNRNGGGDGGTARKSTKRKRGEARRTANTNANKTKCKWCKKFHLGRCRTLDDPNHENYRADKNSGGGNPTRKNNYKGSGVSRRQFEQIRSMIEAENDSSDDSDDDDYGSRGRRGWSKGLSRDECTFVLCQTGNEDQVDEYSDIDEMDLGVSPNKLRKLKHKAKQHTKRMKRRV